MSLFLRRTSKEVAVVVEGVVGKGFLAIDRERASLTATWAQVYTVFNLSRRIIICL